MMKKMILTILMLVGTLSMTAQNPVQNEKRQKFDPAKFETELEQFITKEAGLTQQEAAAFFPLYREMRSKQRVYFDEMRKLRGTDGNDDKKCREAIEKMDKNDLEIKGIQKNYHAKFLKVLPASKVLKAIKAEERFHRNTFQRTVKPGDRKKPGVHKKTDANKKAGERKHSRQRPESRK